MQEIPSTMMTRRPHLPSLSYLATSNLRDLALTYVAVVGPSVAQCWRWRQANRPGTSAQLRQAGWLASLGGLS